MVSGLFLVIVYSYLFKDNKLYRYTEHLYIGFAAAHAMVTGWQNVKERTVALVTQGQWSAAVPLILGFLLYTKFNKRFSHLSRTPLAFMMGVAAGVTISGSVEASFVKQVRATILPMTNLDNIVMVLGTVSTLAFFLFIPLERTKKHGPQVTGETGSHSGSRGPLSGLSLMGRATMMVAFGSSFGFVVMARLSYLVGRLQFLFTKCIPLIPE